MGVTDYGQGRLDASLKRFREALSHYERLPDLESMRLTLFCIGRVLRRLRRPEEAWALLEPACREPMKGSCGEVFVRLEAGRSLLALGRHVEAGRYFNECRAVVERDPSLVRDQPELAPWLDSQLGSATVS
jgi:hypothetical protein